MERYQTQIFYLRMALYTIERTSMALNIISYALLLDHHILPPCSPLPLLLLQTPTLSPKIDKTLTQRRLSSKTFMHTQRLLSSSLPNLKSSRTVCFP